MSQSHLVIDFPIKGPAKGKWAMAQRRTSGLVTGNG